MGFVKCVEIGRRLRQFRHNAGLTQEELAVMLDVTFQQVQKYESGATRLNSDKLQNVAEALSVPVAAFFDDKSDVSLMLSSQERTMLELYRSIKDAKARESLIFLLSTIIRK